MGSRECQKLPYLNEDIVEPVVGMTTAWSTWLRVRGPAVQC